MTLKSIPTSSTIPSKFTAKNIRITEITTINILAMSSLVVGLYLEYSNQ